MAKPKDTESDSQQGLDDLLNRENELRDLRETVLRQRFALVIGLPDMNVHNFVTKLRERWTVGGAEGIWAGHFGFMRGDGFQASLQSRMSITDQFCKRILEEYKTKSRREGSQLNHLKEVIGRVQKRGKKICLLVEDLGIRPTIDDRQMDDLFSNVVQGLVDDCNATFIFFSSFSKQVLRNNSSWGRHLASEHEIYLKPIPLERFTALGKAGKMAWRLTSGIPALMEKLKKSLTDATLTKMLKKSQTDPTIAKMLEGDIKRIQSEVKILVREGKLSEEDLQKMGLSEFVNNQDAIMFRDHMAVSEKPQVVLDGIREALLVEASVKARNEWPSIPIKDIWALLILYLIAKDPKWRERDKIVRNSILLGLSAIRDDMDRMNMMQKDCPRAYDVMKSVIRERASLDEMTDIHSKSGARLTKAVETGRKYIRNHVESKVSELLTLHDGFYFVPRGGSSDGGRKRGKNQGRKTVEANWNVHVDFKIKPSDASAFCP